MLSNGFNGMERDDELDGNENYCIAIPQAYQRVGICSDTWGIKLDLPYN